MERVVFHSDLNNFYASVECLLHPELSNKPVAVCGDPQLRHGIVLAKNMHAKRMGVQTGEAVWQAIQKCPGLVLVHTHFGMYAHYAGKVREIYAEYTDRVESFGIDEAWLELTGAGGAGDPRATADEIRKRIKEEIGITASIGVAENKIFAKLGSDMNKPDATTVITPEDFREKVWPLPARELLYVGRATGRRLGQLGIDTIGDIARCSPRFLASVLGRWGETLWSYANGLDRSPVARMGEEREIKSVGNSTTTPRDLTNSEEVRTVCFALAESVATRLRGHGFKCTTLQISVRDNELRSFERQTPLPAPTNLAGELADRAGKLFDSCYRFERPVRSLGLRGCGLVPAGSGVQLSLYQEEARRARLEVLERTADDIRRRFGRESLRRARLMCDTALGSVDPLDENGIHGISFYHG